jgi:hypothetical protein
MREFDKEEDEKLGGGLGYDEIDEEAKSIDEKRYTIACLDEAENLYVFKAGGAA